MPLDAWLGVAIMVLLAALGPAEEGPSVVPQDPEPAPVGVHLQLPDGGCDELWHALTGDCGFCATLLGALGLRPGCPW